METKQFCLRTVLSVTTERLLTKSKGPRDNGISDLYAILGWMTDDEPFTHQLPRFGKECAPWLLRWFPVLAGPNETLPLLDTLMDMNGGEAGCELWVDSLIKGGIPEWFDVPRIPKDAHERKSPMAELIQMMGGSRKERSRT